MFEFVKQKSFHTIASFVIGVGIAAIFRPGCPTGICTIMKAPPIHEVTESTYQLGSRCYQFKTETADCSAGSGIVEPFVETRRL